MRPVAAFLDGHRHGAISVPVSGSSFATKAGFLLDPERPVCVLASDQAEAQRAIRGLRSVGFLDIPGFVLGGGPEQLETVSVDDLEKLLDEGADVIDVREKDERDDGYIAGTRNIPYRLVGELAADVATDRPVVTLCESGAAPPSRPASSSRTVSTRAPSSTAASARGSPAAIRSPPFAAAGS